MIDLGMIGLGWCEGNIRNQTSTVPCDEMLGSIVCRHSKTLSGRQFRMCFLFLLPAHRGGGLPTFHLSPVCAGKPSLHDWSRSSELLQGRKGSLHWRDKVADLQNLQYADTDVEGLVDVATCSDIR